MKTNFLDELKQLSATNERQIQASEAFHSFKNLGMMSESRHFSKNLILSEHLSTLSITLLYNRKSLKQEERRSSFSNSLWGKNIVSINIMMKNLENNIVSYYSFIIRCEIFRHHRHLQT